MGDYDTFDVGIKQFCSLATIPLPKGADLTELGFGVSVVSMAEFTLRWERAIEAVQLQLRAYVFSMKVGERRKEVVFWVPATWWQHWKREHAPRWLKQRWPVRLEKLSGTVREQAYDLFPHASVIPESLGEPVRFLTVEVDGTHDA